MSSRLELSDYQEAAVIAPWAQKQQMILATAGSGKTLVLTRRAVNIAKDLVSQGAKNERVLCVCFNKAMAAEMHHRIAQLLRAEDLTAVIHATRNTKTTSSVVTIEVRTFHGLGYYIILSSTAQQRRKLNLPEGFLKVMQGATLRKALFHSLQRAGKLQSFANEKAARSTLLAVMKDVDAFKSSVFDRACEALMLHGEWPSFVDNEVPSEFNEYETLLFQNNAMDFNDMIWKSVRMLLQCDRLRSRLAHRYTAVMVDEFQDLSAAQLLLCRTLVSVSNSLTLVGDDDQQIYSFRTGNQWFCHIAAKKVFPNMQTLTLPENRRCPGSVVKAARALILCNPDRAEKNIVPTRSDGLPIHVVGCLNLQLEKQFVVANIERLLPTLERDGGRILVLFRINELLLSFQESMKEAGILTSRKIRTEVTVRPVGARTLTVLALIMLMSASITREKFIWAATNVSAHLEHSVLDELLRKAENEVVTVVTSDNGLSGNTSRQENPYPSPYLRQLTDWYSMRSNDNEIIDGDENLEPVSNLLRRADVLRMHLDGAQSVEELLRHAEAALDADLSSSGASQDSVGEEDYYDGSQTIQGGDDRVGLDAFVDVAARVDAEARRKMKREAAKKEAREAKRQRSNDGSSSTLGNDDDDFEDGGFSQLLSSDLQMSARKRRRVQGLAGARSIGSAEGAILLRPEQLGECISDFCEAAERKLERLERAGGDRESQKERRPRSTDMEDEARTVLSTVHNAKGSTFEYVFLCGANKYNMPNGAVLVSGMQGMGVVPGAPAGVLVEPGNFPPDDIHCQEERRVFFVAQTRATRQVVCTYSADKGGRGARVKDFESMFLGEMFHGQANGTDCFAVESFIHQANDIATVVARDTAKTKREQERNVTHSLKHSETEDKPERGIKRIDVNQAAVNDDAD